MGYVNVECSWSIKDLDGTAHVLLIQCLVLLIALSGYVVISQGVVAPKTMGEPDAMFTMVGRVLGISMSFPETEGDSQFTDKLAVEYQGLLVHRRDIAQEPLCPCTFHCAFALFLTVI
jgi:hypothetical protein